MNVLCLDDNPARLRWFRRQFPAAVTVETADAAIAKLAGGVAWDRVYLDHDLGDEEYADSDRPDTGAAVVRWIVANRPSIGRITVHTLNTPAGNRMVEALRGAGYSAEYESFLRLVERVTGRGEEP